jgi:hypothetical protein
MTLADVLRDAAFYAHQSPPSDFGQVNDCIHAALRDTAVQAPGRIERRAAAVQAVAEDGGSGAFELPLAAADRLDPKPGLRPGRGTEGARPSSSSTPPLQPDREPAQ